MILLSMRFAKFVIASQLDSVTIRSD